MTPLALIAVAFAGVFGLIIGSFLNAVIYRLPRECMSIVRQTRSFCPQCGVQLRWYDNVPVLSYCVWLRGRCRACKKSISWRYPANELLVGAVFAVLAWHDLGLSTIDRLPPSPSDWGVFAVHALVFSVLLVLSWVDWDYRILPDVLTISGIFVAPLVSFAMPQMMPQPLWRPAALVDTAWAAHWTALANGIAGAVAGGVGLWLIGWLGSLAFRKPAMGLGDVKLLAAMGGLVGLWIPMVLVWASFIGATFGIARRVFTNDRYVPFGPFLALGMWMTWLWGPHLFDVVFSQYLIPR